MPKPARFQTAKAQQIAVAVMTFIALVLALGLAQLYTQAHQVNWHVELVQGQIGELRLPLPKGWEPIALENGNRFFAGQPMLFLDPATADRQLAVGRINLTKPATPEQVLEGLLRYMVGNRPRRVAARTSRTFRTGDYECVYYYGERLADKGKIVGDWIVLMMTSDQRPWMFWLSMSPSAEAVPINEDLLLRIVDNATDTAIEASPDPAGTPDAPAPRGTPGTRAVPPENPPENPARPAVETQ